jgi:transposase
MQRALKNQSITAEQAATLLIEKDQLIESQSDIIEKKSSIISAQKRRIEVLEEYLRLERARLYGRSSEKNPHQGEIFDEAELLHCDSDEDDDVIDEPPSADKSKKKAGRKGLSKSLPRHQVHIHLSDEEKDGAIDTFYTVVKEELDIEPAKARVIEYLQEKAVFTDGDKRRMKSATLPKHPLGKCIASVSLLAFVIVSKYCDGLPLYRLENILKRYGGEITRTSLANWVIRLSLQIQPLINLMRDHQLSYDYLLVDETRIKVLKEPDRSAKSDKWMWVSRGGPPDSPVVLFDYDPSRGKEVPLRLYEGFKGYFQCDGYAGYDALCRQQGITRLGCMDHARRKFTDAKKAASGVKKQQGSVAKYDIALAKIKKLYAIERRIKTWAPADKYQLRQEQSQPLLDDLKAWLDKNISKVAKDSKTHEAMQYTLNQWPKLIVYCDDGRLNISNILAENAIRPFVIGRKGWLFADTPKGATASANWYSLVETAKANGLEPFAYLREMLRKLPYAETVEELEALLPWNINITS